MNDAIDLAELLEQVRFELEDKFPEPVWVRAEVASVQVKGSASRPGHCYLELCQTDAGGAVVAKVHAIIWQYNYLQISALFKAATGEPLRAGMKILASATVNFKEQYGLSLIIDNIDPSYTLGDAEAQKRETIARLESEGLMDLQKELALPPLPYRIAVISSATAAGYGDFRRHLMENEYGFVYDITLIEALMQGDGAPASIEAALAQVDGRFDAALLLRGGGSVLDLACFDDYTLCAAIARCPVPVLTAIGHDRDYHVADMVASDFVKTPTALADVFIDAFAAEDERISQIARRLQLLAGGRISEMENRVSMLESSIFAADPRKVLSRGYTLVTDSRGVVLKSAGAASASGRIRILFSDGQVDAEVIGAE